MKPENFKKLVDNIAYQLRSDSDRKTFNAIVLDISNEDTYALAHHLEQGTPEMKEALIKLYNLFQVVIKSNEK